MHIPKNINCCGAINYHLGAVSTALMKARSNIDVLINEIDQFYKNHSEILSKNGKKPHARSRLPETKKWLDNIERFYELNPKRRPRK